jgi:signal transduction histidine kinase
VIYSVPGIGIIILIIFNFLGWFFMKNLENDILQQLKTQLNNLGSVSSRLINGEDLEGLYQGEETNPATLYYQQLLWEIKKSGNLENILILSLDKRLLIDYRVNYKIGDTLSVFPINDSYFNQAILGQRPQPELNQFSGEYYLTSYTPIVNQVVGNTVAVLIMEAPTNFFSTLHYFKNGVFYFGIGALAVIIIFSTTIVLSLRQLLRIENKLQEQERMAQLGQMAAMVAHEIRPPLSIIKGSADVLQKKYMSEKEELFSFIPEEIDRLNRLVNDFLQFARKRRLHLKMINPNQQIQSTVSQIKDIKIKMDLAENCPETKLDQDAFKQIILNIVDNGTKALNENGQIHIKTEIQNGKPYKFVPTIEDNGKGMRSDTLKEIFKPFYSTRSSGSGLGMTITKQLVEGMNGKIDIRSKLNEGTTVSLEFPSRS